MPILEYRAVDTYIAIAEPTRRVILEHLAHGPLTVTALVEQVGASQSAISKHLKALRDAELVTVRIDGPHRWYGVRPDGLRDLDRWLDTFRALWSTKLDALERHLDETHPQEDR